MSFLLRERHLFEDAHVSAAYLPFTYFHFHFLWSSWCTYMLRQHLSGPRVGGGSISYFHLLSLSLSLSLSLLDNHDAHTFVRPPCWWWLVWGQHILLSLTAFSAAEGYESHRISWLGISNKNIYTDRSVSISTSRKYKYRNSINFTLQRDMNLIEYHGSEQEYLSESISILNNNFYHPVHHLVHHPVHQEGVLAFRGSFCDRATFVKSLPRLDCPSSTNNPQTLSLFAYLPNLSRSQMPKKFLTKKLHLVDGWGLTFLFSIMTPVLFGCFTSYFKIEQFVFLEPYPNIIGVLD